MSPLGPGDEATIREIVLRELRGSDFGVLIRQLQGGTAKSVTGSLLNGWSVYTSLRWWVDGQRMAHIFGELSVGTTTAGTHIWALPAAIVPPDRSYFFGQMGGTGSTGGVGAVQVTPAGFLQVSDEGNFQAGTVIHLPVMSYPLA